MITLKCLELTNWGPIDHKELSFPESGVISLSGDCGSGKSHIVKAIKMCCTTYMPWDGSTAETERSMGEFVKRGEDKAVVTATFQVGPDELVVQRTITLNKDQPLEELIASGVAPKAKCAHKLWYKNQVVSTESKVNAIILELFGLNNTAQASAVVVEHGQSGIIWKKARLERMKDFQSLSGADKMAALNKYTASRMDHFKTTDYTADKSNVDAEVIGLEEEAKTLQQELSREEADVSAGFVETLANQQLYRGMHEQRSKLEEEQNRLIKEAEQLKGARDEASLRCEHWKTTYKIVDSERIGYLRSRLAAYKDAEKLKSRIIFLNSEIARIRNGLGEDPAPALHTVRTNIEDANRIKSSAEVALREANQTLQVYGDSGKCPVCASDGTCPQCGHTIGDFKDMVAKWTKTRDDNTALLTGLHPILTNLALESARLSEAQRQYQHTLLMLEKLEGELSGTTVSSGVTEEDYSKDVAEYNYLLQQEKLMQEEMQKANGLKAELDRLDKQWNTLIGRMEVNHQNLSKELPALLPEEELKKMEAAVKQAEEYKQHRSILQGKLEATQAALDRARTRQKLLDEKIAQSRVIEQSAELLANLRAASHPSALPKKMAGAYVSRINEYLSKYCAELGVPFTLFINLETLGLMIKTDEMVAPAVKYTSNGQFTMVAWAWNLALYSMHATNIGFMILDEPNTGLDTNFRIAVAEVVTKMGDYFRNRGLQFIMITHNIDDLLSDVEIRL